MLADEVFFLAVYNEGNNLSYKHTYAISFLCVIVMAGLHIRLIFFLQAIKGLTAVRAGHRVSLSKDKQSPENPILNLAVVFQLSGKGRS